MRKGIPLAAAVLAVAAVSGIAVAQQTTAPAVPPATSRPAASPSCARFDAQEEDGRAQVNRRLVDIDTAAGTGDIDTFCGATSDLLFVYRTMRDAAAQCSDERAARWSEAASSTEAALAGTCR